MSVSRGKKAASVSGILIAGTRLSMRKSFGTYLPRRIPFGTNGFTQKSSEGLAFGNDSRDRRSTLHLSSASFPSEIKWRRKSPGREGNDGSRQSLSGKTPFHQSTSSFVGWPCGERLTTRDQITWTETDKRCALCMTDDETIEHLFFKCTETKKVWEEIRGWTGIRRRTTTIKGAIKWIARNKTGSAIVQKARRIGLMASVYLIWKARNALINEGTKFDAARTTFLIKTTTYSLLFSRFPDDQVTQHLPDQRSQQ